MIFRETTLKDAWVIEPELRGDERGSFARTMCKAEFAARGLATDYVQQNMSVSATAGTVRGMHFQRAPFTEAKLVRCVRGRILDVIVDMRSGSPTYLKHEGFELSAENHRQLYVPPGFAHAFQTLVDDIEVSYLVSAPYTPDAEGGVRYSDPLLDIQWPLPVSVISDKDANWPLIDPDAEPVF
ncbi:dTDP-4-dehydrorhamnose 3,5-epimerase [Sphingomonas crocodyli]|uniref:dTDP-4-dehydrorhamnose 3,5-epimerase n=1 Tax=Sphingomonas crocodyli TaxID=1979270 RepID=A0A437M7D9_9SPHN|nr:dTDP-4-dehydrorhamnose 3,5-epimerase [Sphingomonas crocodyli]RVT93569.1 dTDP-4-dehydrorhamnose 3,5-epimerase [Sphingomonas crocodyli]